MTTVCVISSYKEGHLLGSTIESAARACDHVVLLEGPVGDLPVEQHSYQPEEYFHVRPIRRYKDDADKRNHGLRWVQSKWPGEDTWLVWLDGDEVLIWGEYLHDWIERAQHVTGVGGFPIRLVELDGSVVFSNGRIVRTSIVKQYLLAASQVELTNGMIIGLPHEHLCTAGGIPVAPQGHPHGQGLTPEQMADWLARCRPPVGGEPHILHRSLLRDPNRGVERQHLPEAKFFE